MKILYLPCICAIVLLSIPQSRAITFTITTDTSPLIGQASGPFSLDFQFIDGSGSGDANNTVTLSAFNFYGGSWTGSPTLTGGASTGAGTITLTDSSFFNELFQGFTPGTKLSFQVSMTTALDAGAPDEFSFAILDSTLSEIPTMGPGDAFVTVDIDSANPTIQTFSSDLGRTTIDIAAPTISGAVVLPEGGVPIGLVGGLWLAGLLWSRRLMVPTADS